MDKRDMYVTFFLLALLASIIFGWDRMTLPNDYEPPRKGQRSSK